MLEKLNFKAESTASRISAEPGDVAVEAKFLSKALAARGVTEYKIGKVEFDKSKISTFFNPDRTSFDDKCKIC